jgi:hypothetical protein
MNTEQAFIPTHPATRLRQGATAGFIALVFFLWSNAARLRIFQINEYYVNALRLTAVVLIGAGCVMTFRSSVYHALFRNTYFRCILALLACVMMPTFLTGVLQYGQSTAEIIRLPMFFYAFFIFALLYSLWRETSITPLISAMVYTIATVAAIYTVISLFPGLSSALLSEHASIGYRFGRERLTATASINNEAVFGILYSMVMLQFKKLTLFRRAVWITVLLVLSYYLLFVVASRVRLFAAMICVVFFFLRYISLGRLFASLIMVCLLALMLQLATGVSVLQPFVDSYASLSDAGSGEGDTVTVRQDGMKYYWRLFRETGYVGIGMVSPSRADATDAGYAMSQLSYNPSDIGVIAVLLFFGIPGTLVTIFIVLNIARDTHVIIRHGPLDHRITSMAIQLYLLFYIVSFYHIFLLGEYALEWGLLFFALSHMMGRGRGGPSEPSRLTPLLRPDHLALPA